MNDDDKVNGWTTTPLPPVENSPHNTPAAKNMGGEQKKMPVFSAPTLPATPDNTGVNTRWQAGVSGNPNGRPKGSRNRYSEVFLKTLMQDFEANGAAVLCALRTTNAEAYLRIMASLLPRGAVAAFDKSFDVNFDAITHDELVQLLDQIQREKFIQKTLESVAG
ncbi:MAG: DUF5681 domain-containing protein [Rickettsiales bacterium]